MRRSWSPARTTPSQIVIVHHRTPDVLERALLLLARHAPGVPVRVLDTAPQEGIDGRVRASHPHAVLDPCANHSYAHATNRALREARGPLVMVMNADVWIGPETVHRLAAPFADPSVAVVGPLARTRDGRVQDQGLPYRAFTAAAAQGRSPRLVRDVPWVSGCAFVARVAAARDVGGMDASLRFGNEDLEWCLRLRSRGWRVLLSGSEVVHLGGSSTPDAPAFLLEGLRGGMVVARRHHRPWRRIAQRLAVGGYAAVRGRWGGAERRPAWRTVERMMWRGAFDESPFGPDLASADPSFARAVAPPRREP